MKSPTFRRSMMSCIAIGAALALAGLGLVSADPGAKGPGHHRPPGDRDCMPSHVKKQLPTYDTNKNGRLDPSEHRAMREAQRKADLASYDKNRDGRLDRKERWKLRYDRMVEHFEALDSNRDAEISRAEAKGSCTPLEWGFSRVDLDANGAITWAEFEKAAPKGPPGHRRRGPRPR